MAGNIITLEKVLPESDYRAIDDFCSTHRGLENLAAVAAFLEENFALKLTTDPDIVAGYAADSSNLPAHADALARPTSKRQAAAVLRAGQSAKIPITLSGGRSNLTGSATAEAGILLSTAALQEPSINIDAENARVLTPVNIVLEELREKILEETGKTLYFPVDPTSRGDAWIGGIIACNASGFIPGEAGATREWVEELEVLLPNGLQITARRGECVSSGGEFILDDGEKLSSWPVPTYARPAIKNASGPWSSTDGRLDLVDMFVGSEGIFGLVTGCTFRLAPRPETCLDLFFSLPDEPRAIAFHDYVNRLLDGNLSCLSAFEYFGVNSLNYMDHRERFFFGDNQVAVYLQIPIARKEDLAKETALWFERIIASGCGIEPEAVILLDSEPKQRLFMEARHSMPANALEVIQRYGTCTIMTDALVPPENFPAFLDTTHTLLRREGIEYLAFGHLGDCHIHFTLLPTREKMERAIELYDQIIARAVELGGVYSGEHGTGKRKRKDFLTLYNQAAVEQLKTCKGAVDPDLLLNRGNIFLP